MFSIIFGQNLLLKSEKNALSVKQGGFEPQYFTLKTIKKLADLSIQNVLNNWPNLRLGVLINFVLTKKRVYCNILRHIPSTYNLEVFLSESDKTLHININDFFRHIRGKVGWLAHKLFWHWQYWLAPLPFYSRAIRGASVIGFSV